MAGVRLLLYPVSPVGDMAWLGDTIRAVVEFLRWRHAAAAVSPRQHVRVATRGNGRRQRAVTFFSVGVSFRLAMLISILGGALLSTIGGRPAGESFLYFVLCFGFGLIAIAVARIDEKAIADTISPGTIVPCRSPG